MLRNSGGILMRGENKRNCREIRLSDTLPATNLTQTGLAGKETPFPKFRKALEIFIIF
jgi:hypothetical protein